MKRHYDSKRKNHYDIVDPEKRDRLKEVTHMLIYAWVSGRERHVLQNVADVWCR